MTNEKLTSGRSASEQQNPAAPSAAIALGARLAHEIPKPRDWQAFQRYCVLLFRAELNDPNAQEYGRSGQEQGGIDVLGKREGNPKHYVGVQCRHIKKPLTEATIMKEARAALTLKADLKELIFATTAPHDTHATDAAISVERTLQSEGSELTIVVYGWEALQNLIAVHDVAYAAFCPSIVANLAPQTIERTPSESIEFGARLADQVVERLRQTSLVLATRETGVAGLNDEDPALHARIDTYRDLFKEERQPNIAEARLLALLEKEPLENKPWARFRILTNLGVIAVDLGREAEGAVRFEAAYAIRPQDPNALANLAVARTIQGRHEEAIDLANQALRSTPRANHAVAYLLQAAARSGWQGDPETLIPPDMVGTESADLGLAEFLRTRRVTGWAERCLEISRRHPEADAFKRIGALAVLALATEKTDFLAGDRALVTPEELSVAADEMKTVAEHFLNVGFAHEHDLFACVSNAASLLRLAGRDTECEALLKRGLQKTPKEPALRRILALLQVANGRRAEALETLGFDKDDAESQLLSAELLAIDDPNAGLARTLAIPAKALDARPEWLRWNLIGELSVKAGDAEHLKSAIAELRMLDATDVTADLLEIRGAQKAGLDEEAVQRRLRGVASNLPRDAVMMKRYIVAEELQNQKLHEEASRLLEGHVDLSRRSPAAMLYLQNLAAARRDDAFHKALEDAAPAVRDDPAVLWIVALHAWNIGNLPGAFKAVEALLAQHPDDPPALLLKIAILLRQSRSSEVLAELDRPVENLNWSRLQELVPRRGIAQALWLRRARCVLRLSLIPRASRQFASLDGPFHLGVGRRTRCGGETESLGYAGGRGKCGG